MAAVLVVEDNPANQRLMNMLLKSMGHSVACASSGEEGLAMLKEDVYDIVLLDMQLPGMDGFEMGKRAREIWGSKIKILAVTALAMAGDRERVMAAGCDDYLEKPVSVAELRTKIGKLLEE